MSRGTATSDRQSDANRAILASRFSVRIWREMYKPGDRVVYTTTKHSAHPGPRAEDVHPEQHGEGYWYDVKKYWIVCQVQPDGRLTVITRRGKERAVAADDPRLRPARWWESLLFGSRFPKNNSRSPPGQESQSSAA